MNNEEYEKFIDEAMEIDKKIAKVLTGEDLRACILSLMTRLGTCIAHTYDNKKQFSSHWDGLSFVLKNTINNAFDFLEEKSEQAKKDLTNAP